MNKMRFQNLYRQSNFKIKYPFIVTTFYPGQYKNAISYIEVWNRNNKINLNL